MEINKKRWFILAASCLINLCVGSLYTWSVFAPPMADYINRIKETSLNVGNLAIVFTVANLVGPITMISGGRINDLFGPRKVILTGGLMFGGGMFLSSFARSVEHLVFTYGILIGLGMGLVYGSIVGNSVKIFPDKRGFAGGLITASYGLGSVLIPFIASKLIILVGILNTFKILGLTFITIISMSSFFIEKCPKNFELKTFVAQRNKNKDSVEIDKDWREMIKSLNFYLMLSTLTCGAFSGLMCISQAQSIGQDLIGLPIATATIFVSVLSLFNTVGRLVAGYISDKIGRSNMLISIFIISIASLLLLYTCKKGDTIKFFIGISATGFSFGSIMGIYPAFTTDRFGSKNNSVNYGIMFIGFAIAGFFGPTIMSKLYIKFNSYKESFLVATIFSILGLIMIHFDRRLIREQ